MSKKLKSVKKCLKHHQTTLESHRVWFEDDWDGSERPDFFFFFFGYFGGILEVFWRYFGALEYPTKNVVYLETVFLVWGIMGQLQVKKKHKCADWIFPKLSHIKDMYIQ